MPKRHASDAEAPAGAQPGLFDDDAQGLPSSATAASKDALVAIQTPATA